MKTKQEIVSEIEANKMSKVKFVEAYKDGRIDKRTLEFKLNEYSTVILALSWVLGED